MTEKYVTGFPYFNLARSCGVPYRDVCVAVSLLDSNFERFLDHEMDLDANVLALVQNAYRFEQRRRLKVIRGEA